MATLHTLPSPMFKTLQEALKGKQFEQTFNVLGHTDQQEQVIKVHDIVFQRGSSLIFTDVSVQFIAIYAKDWYFDGEFSIGYHSHIRWNGVDGPPAPPTPPTPSGWGVDGNNGATGARGEDGGHAPLLPRIVIFGQRAFRGEPGRSFPVEFDDVHASLKFDGMPGGKGGNGGIGGDGTPGNQGEPGRDGNTWFEHWTECDGGPGWGGRGGDGGAGGVGGRGGHGGDGANVFMFVSSDIEAIFNAFKVSVAGGPGGHAGFQGGNGSPAMGGAGGEKTEGCRADRPGPSGRKAPSCEADPGASFSGSNGNVRLYAYDGFSAELD